MPRFQKINVDTLENASSLQVVHIPTEQAILYLRMSIIAPYFKPSTGIKVVQFMYKSVQTAYYFRWPFGGLEFVVAKRVKNTLSSVIYSQDSKSQFGRRIS